MKMLFMQCKIEMLRIIRNPYFVFWSLMMPILFYFISKMFGQTVMHALSIIVIFTAGFLINGVHLSAGQWIGSALWILVASIPFLAMGTLVGSMKRVDTASGVSNVIYMLMAVLGGMWMPIDNFPSFLQTIGKWLPSYNYGSGVWSIAAGQTPELKPILILAGYLVLFMVLSIYIRKKQEAV